MQEQPTGDEFVAKLTIPLLLRLLEYARESSTSDIDLHWILERIVNLANHGYTMSMAHYDKLVPEHRLVTLEQKPA